MQVKLYFGGIYVQTARRVCSLWLLNLLPMGVSSRGNAESVLAALVLGTLLCMEGKGPGVCVCVCVCDILALQNNADIAHFVMQYRHTAPVLIPLNYLFCSSPASDVGSHALWSVSPYEDLPHYICSAHHSDPAHTRDQIRGGPEGVEEVHWVCGKLPQPRAVPLCKCGRGSFLSAHGALLLHVR